MNLFALTGGPGCGKSTASRIFHEEFFWRVVDADRIGHELYEKREPALLEALEARWGKGILIADGGVDRSKIAEIVFSDDRELEFLNRTMHPLIFDRIKKEIDSVEPDEILLLDIPLLFESNWQILCDHTICVWSSRELQIERLLARGWTMEHIEKRINSQLPSERKLELADYGLINNGTIESLTAQCRLIDNEYRKNKNI